MRAIIKAQGGSHVIIAMVFAINAMPAVCSLQWVEGERYGGGTKEPEGDRVGVDRRLNWWSQVKVRSLCRPAGLAQAGAMREVLACDVRSASSEAGGAADGRAGQVQLLTPTSARRDRAPTDAFRPGEVVISRDGEKG
ncbi:hypothetical protein [Streptomyces sp. 2A115]|uniref:hypothetical protein n=1 Tax=Streptomyces sp. 2A115 TaxID=3457439 RepID=UPI003FCF68C9